MTVYYKKCSSIPRLPENISKELIALAERYVERHEPMQYWFRELDFKNKDSLSYVTADDKIVSSGGVGLYSLSYSMNQEICDLYKGTDTELAVFDEFFLQVVTDGKFVAPHSDPGRKVGYLYILKAGGTNVRTKWWRVKDEFTDLPKIDGYGVPYEKLDVVEDHCLEEGTWHYLNFEELHSVENQETLRIGLCGSPDVDIAAYHNEIKEKGFTSTGPF